MSSDSSAPPPRRHRLRAPGPEPRAPSAAPQPDVPQRLLGVVVLSARGAALTRFRCVPSSRRWLDHCRRTSFPGGRQFPTSVAQTGVGCLCLPRGLSRRRPRIGAWQLRAKTRPSCLQSRRWRRPTSPHPARCPLRAWRSRRAERRRGAGGYVLLRPHSFPPARVWAGAPVAARGKEAQAWEGQGSVPGSSTLPLWGRRVALAREWERRGVRFPHGALFSGSPRVQPPPAGHPELRGNGHQGPDSCRLGE